MMKPQFLTWLVLAAALAGGTYAYRHFERAGPVVPKGNAEARPLPVVTRAAERQAMPLQLSAIGTVQPIATVALRPRIDSVVEAVHFSEGDEVTKGQLLFTLDARPAAAQLLVAEANLERDRAQLVKARADVVRYAELLKTNAVARQQYETSVAQVGALEGSAKADQAAIEATRLTLAYTRIEAPMAGRTGAILAKPGNQVRAGDANPLVMLTQLRPIQVAFNVAERELGAIRAAARAAPMVVQVQVPGDPGTPIGGTLDFIDNAVDSGTGTILLKASFANADTRLWPGQFVDVLLTLRTDPDLLTIPAEAVQIGQDSALVYVVQPDHTVEVRPVVVLRTLGGRSAIAAGLKDGERVVIQGQSRLVPGARVIEKSAATGETPAKAEERRGGLS